MVIAACGNLEHDHVVDLVARHFADLPSSELEDPMPADYTGGEFREVRELDQAHIVLGFSAPGYGEPDYYPAMLLSTLLGGGMSSRLFQEARERRGLCYSIYAFHVPYSDIGMFGLYAGTDAADTSELMRLIVDEIGGTIATISEAEVARAKAQMKAGLLMALESSGARIEQLARQMIVRGRPIPLHELVERVEAVTVESARAAGRAMISRGKLATAVLGLGSGLESAAAIAETLTRRAA